MFYQESYSCTMYKDNPQMVEKIDFCIGTLVGDIANRITPSLIVDKAGVQLEIAKQLLFFYEAKGILKKMYAITCSNPECDQILKIVEAEQLVETISLLKDEIRYCFDCEEQIEDISSENIFLLYKRVKIATTTKSEVDRTLCAHNVIEEKLPEEKYFFYKADSLNVDEVYKCYFSFDESAKEHLQEMLKLITPETVYNTTTEKGNALEDLCLELFKHSKVFEASKTYRTPTNQLDVIVKSVLKMEKLSVLDDLAPYFICECKNEQKKSGNTYFHKLYSVLEGTDAKVGILFSINKCAKTFKTLSREKYLLSGKKIKIINITKKDLEKVITEEINLFALLKEKIDAITINSDRGLKDKGLDYI